MRARRFHRWPGPGRTLPYLEGVEAEEGDAGRVRVPEDAAVFFGPIILKDDRRVLGGNHWSVGSVNTVTLSGPYIF